MSAFILYDDGDGVLQFDVVTHENQNKSNMVTGHPVEVGSDITDHVRPNPDKVTIEGYVSNAPVYSNDGVQVQEPLNPPSPPQAVGLNSAVNAIGSTLQSLISGPQQFVASVFEFPNYTDYVAADIDILDRLQSTAQLVTVVCPSRVYENMLVEDFEVDREVSTGTGANFTVNLRQIRTVTSSITNAPKPTVPRANTTKAKGDQSGVVPNDQKESLLHNLLGGS